MPVHPTTRLLAAMVLAAASLVQAGCDRPQQPVPDPTATAAAAVVADPATAGAAQTGTSDEAEQGPSTSRDPRRVVIAWAKAMSLKDWDAAYRYWGDKGARSGLPPAEFAARWSKVADPQFDIGEGQGEGAAGSLYYTAPITLIEGRRRVKGQIVLRRVNDVPGASEDQLRWHIERLDLQP